MRLARPLAALALVLPALLPAAALAQDFQANTYTTDNQLRPDVAADEDGNFVVVWESEGDPPVAASSAVRGRRFDSSGAPLGSDFQISTVTGSHAGARVAMAPAGEFVVVWSYGDQCFLTPDACDIRARRFNASGAPLGSEFVVNSLTAGIQGYPDVARAPNGSFVIVWESQQSPDTDQSGGTILGRRFSASGTPMGPDFQLNSFTTSVQRRPTVAAGSDGRFVAAWQSLGSPGSDSADFSVLARRFDSGGNPLAGDFQVNSYTTGYQGRPEVALGPGDDFVVTWQSFGSPGSDTSGQSILARRFDAAGSAQGGDFQVNSYTTGNQIAPAVAIAPGGELLVSWNQNSATPNPDPFDVWGRLFNPGGTAQGSGFRLNTFGGDVQADVRAAALPDGDFLAAWTSHASPDSDTSGSSIRAARLGGDCTPGPTRLCLNGGRFAVDVAWRTSQGQQGAGQAVPLTADSGYFWFFNPDNVELILKVLDACSFNGYYWTFSAGLTNVEVDVTVTDSLTGLQAAYHNPLSQPFEPILDTQSLAACGGAGASAGAPAGEELFGDRQAAEEAPAEELAAAAAEAAGPGIATRGTAPDLTLLGGRFRVEVEWRTPQGEMGFGQPVQLTDRAAYFWFFRPENVEMILKMQDACTFNDRYWVFSAGLTNVEVAITVTDTSNETVRTYFNPLSQPFPAILDTGAFDTCP